MIAAGGEFQPNGRWLERAAQLGYAAASTAFLTDCGNAIERKNAFG